MKQNVNVNVLCIDLDGTLIHEDSTLFAIIKLIKRNVFNIILVLFWRMKGKIFLKNALFKRIVVDADEFTYNYKLISYITKLKQDYGVKLILATGAHKNVAESVGEKFKLFDQIISSTETVNMISNEKLQKLDALFVKYDYAGNSHQDISIWKHANCAIIVNPTKTVKKRIKEITNISCYINDNTSPSFFYTITQALKSK